MGGWKNVLAMLKGGGAQKIEVVLTRELEVLAVVMGVRTKFPHFKRGRKRFYRLEGGGAQKFSDS